MHLLMDVLFSRWVHITYILADLVFIPSRNNYNTYFHYNNIVEHINLNFKLAREHFKY